ncbi:MAG TPA: dethiobiotin synthase [Solirubrobacteraceae bacterium]|jgi:dethiobiotin synthetase
MASAPDAASLRGCFVTGSDTGVGKTVLTAAIVASLRERGEAVCVRKPILTGLDDPDPGSFSDDELLALASGERAEAIAPLRYGPPVSPHLAAELAGEEIDVDALLEELRAAPRPLIVEGIGGLLVPIAPGWDVRRLALELGLGVVVAARAALGTINHTLLTIEAARAGGLDLRAVVLTPWPAQPGTLERSNLETIERLGRVPVATLEELPELSAAALAAAGSRLPYESWLT